MCLIKEIYYKKEKHKMSEDDKPLGNDIVNNASGLPTGVNNFDEKLGCVVGLRESKKTIEKMRAKTVYLAQDADEWVKASVLSLCNRYHVKMIGVPSKKQMGEHFKIDVSAAVVTELKG